MSETLISFFLSSGIIIALIAWGYLCIAWPERPDQAEVSRGAPETETPHRGRGWSEKSGVTIP